MDSGAFTFASEQHSVEHLGSTHVCTSRLSPAHTVQDALRESFEAKQAALEVHDKMLSFQKVWACAPLSVVGSTC